MRVAEAYPGTLCVCLDEMGPDSFKGRFYHRFNEEAVGFIDFFQMVLKAEKIFDCAGAPMAYQSDRSFKQQEKSAKRGRRPELSRIDKTVNHEGKKATFIINVQYRQHSSWQGRINWIEGNRSKSFRSVLELIKLIDSAVEDQSLQLIKPDSTDRMGDCGNVAEGEHNE